MHLKTSCLHKEFSPGQWKLHEHYIQNLLLTLHIDPSHGPARNIINGLELTSKIIDGLLSAKDVGEKLLAEFVKTRLATKISLKGLNKVTYTNGNFRSEGGPPSSGFICS